MCDIEADVDFDELLVDVSPELDIGFDFSAPEPKKLFTEHKRKAWDGSVEPRCDFDRKVRLTRRSGVWFVTIWQKSIVGRTLSDIKADPSMVERFADAAASLIADILGSSLSHGGWAICTAPKRRHKVRNFATLVSMSIAARLSIPFYEDVAFCQTRQRVGAVFSLNVLPAEPNVIVFDDIVTTGQTIAAMKALLVEHQKNTFLFAGINNLL